MVIMLPSYYLYGIRPKNSLELYQKIISSENYDDFLNLTLTEENIIIDKNVYLQMMNDPLPPDKIQQFTVIQGATNSYLIETTPGKTKIKIINMQEVPDEVRTYFMQSGNFME